jgi:hypothetical protein
MPRCSRCLERGIKAEGTWFKLEKLRSGCRHLQYTKEQVGQKWISHSAVLVQVKRVCCGCELTVVDWEWGDDSQTPRMLPDEGNYLQEQLRRSLKILRKALVQAWKD